MEGDETGSQIEMQPHRPSWKEDTSNLTGRNFAEGGAGFLADLAIGGMRYAKSSSRDPEQALSEKMHDVLDRLEAHRGLGMGLGPRPPEYSADRIDGWPPAPRKSQLSYNAILKDIHTAAAKKLNHIEKEEQEEALKEAEEHRHVTVGKMVEEWALHNHRKTLLGCIIMWAVLVVVWELAMRAIEDDLDCNALDGKDGVWQCLNARDVVQEAHHVGNGIQCSDYKCAAPWIRAPGVSRCEHCGCGKECDMCDQCICLKGVGEAMFHVCRKFDRYPGAWAITVRWVLSGIGLFTLLVIAVKWAIANRASKRLIDDAKNREVARLERLALKRDLKRIKTDVVIARVSGDGWKQEEPRRVFLRRMKAKLGDHDFQRLMANTAAGETEPLVRPDRDGQVDLNAAEEAHKMVHDGVEDVLQAAFGTATASQKRQRSKHLAKAFESRGKTRKKERRESHEVSPDRQSTASKKTSRLGCLSAARMAEGQLIEQFYQRVHETVGHTPTLRELFDSMTPGVPPATNIHEDLLASLRKVVLDHPSGGEPVEMETFKAEWADLSHEFAPPPPPAHSRPAPPKETQPQPVPSGMLSKMLQLAQDTLLSESEESDESFSEEGG
eukprot:Sspe_Gene.55604::Locus_30572_Transcript_1_1_Confidence_1.000_Length_1878::g.55604::m.55604